jgi:hypothetical protein
MKWPKRPNHALLLTFMVRPRAKSTPASGSTYPGDPDEFYYFTKFTKNKGGSACLLPGKFAGLSSGFSHAGHTSYT